MQPLDPDLLLAAIVTTGLAVGLVKLGLEANVLGLKTADRRCPSCGRSSRAARICEHCRTR